MPSGVVRLVTTGQLVLLIAVAAALVFAVWRAAVDGRFRGTHPVHGAPAIDAHDARADVWAVVTASLGGDLGLPGARSTLVQFSSAFCAPCRATRRILGEVTEIVPDVRHVEIDAEHHLDLVRTLGILRTPTTLVLDATGREVSRAQGAPTKQQVLMALGAV